MSYWHTNYVGPLGSFPVDEYDDNSYEYNNLRSGSGVNSYYNKSYDFNNYGVQINHENNLQCVDCARNVCSIHHITNREGSVMSNTGTSSTEKGVYNLNSTTVLNSNLTPLAKEFTPSGSVPVQGNSDGGRRYGAIKRNTYWNKDVRHNNRSEPRQNNVNYDAAENKYDRNKRERNNYKIGQTSGQQGSQNVTFRDFNRSSEQNQGLQHPKAFSQQVKHVDQSSRSGEHSWNEESGSGYNSSGREFGSGYNSNGRDFGSGQNSSGRDFGNGHNSNGRDFGSGYNSNGRDFGGRKNNYSGEPHRYGNYNRSSYNNRSKGYKNNYKRDYDNYQVEKRCNEIKNSNYSSMDKKNDYYGNERNYEGDKKRVQVESYQKKKSGFQNFKKKLDAGSQRERLQQLVECRLLECLVCCEKLRHTDQIWSCKQCYHILHLQCTKRWAESSKLDAGWRCPACQNVYQDVPTQYVCYCTKEVNPVLDPNEIPHSCGQVCARKGRSCSHTCTLVCHPGPCPDCNVMIPRSCGCGATKPIVKCSSTVPVTCAKTCEKFLNCTLHKCDKKCHEGSCDECVESLKQECYCGKQGRKIKCCMEAKGSSNYECGDTCGKLLACGNHKCELKCHAGPCDPCSWSPELITTCPCGLTKLTEKRISCLDSIPCCDKVCNKTLFCGQPNAPHRCTAVCHEGSCPECSKTTMIRCRCGHMDKEVPCSIVTTKADDARCEKKCTKKRMCGKHKCNQFCCIEVDHICPLPCNRSLPCGQHRCEQTCHKGRCAPCWRTSFEELYCECGSTVLYPPVACGTRPPPCDQPCSRPRSCDHEVLHNCHTGPCPLCTVLCKKWCYGHHEQRATIQCHQESFSCGLPCGMNMPCGKHKCNQLCHTGPCKVPCNQPCNELRAVCGHPCNQPCHTPPCPETSCKSTVLVTCQCGLRKSNRICNDLAVEYENLAMSQLVTTMEEMQTGRAVDLANVMTAQRKTTGPLKILECNDECRLIERNRRLAIGLQIRNPDLSSKLAPRYSDFMRNWTKRDPKFCQQVHDKLTELVQLSKQSKQSHRSYSFETMNRDKRHFVHEYCEHFGCESVAYDPEPNRNVVATAFKDKSWLPSYSLLAVIQRENGHRKVPGPQQLLEKGSASKSEAVSLKLPGRMPRPSTPPEEYLDYIKNP